VLKTLGDFPEKKQRLLQALRLLALLFPSKEEKAELGLGFPLALGLN
jgi:hypothetical protein